MERKQRSLFHNIITSRDILSLQIQKAIYATNPAGANYEAKNRKYRVTHMKKEGKKKIIALVVKISGDFNVAIRKL